MQSEGKEIVRQGYDAVSTRYRADDDNPAHYEGWLRELTDRLPGSAQVLDLGCGCGVPLAQRLAQLGHRVLGVDTSSVQIERARRLVPNARFTQGDASELAFDPATFDAVICLYVLIHLPVQEQKALVGKLGTWLRPTGVLLATVGAVAHTGEEPDWLGGGLPMWWSDPGADAYREWITAAGMTIERDEFVPEGNSGHQLFLARAQ